MRNLIMASAAAATLVAGIGFGTAAMAQAGSYQQSCRNPRNVNGALTAECADAQGRYHSTSIAAGQCRGDIANANGTLSCPGATGSAGPAIVAGPGPQAQRQDDRRDDRRDDHRDDRAGAAVAGAVVGALLGANGQVLVQPPVYGDPRYGDPRYDWRYTQNGWGYGRRPGEWVAIRDRADWLDRRIDRAQRDGRIGRRDARDLHRQLISIQDMEARYLRDGRLGPGERADLDRRFDDLSARIRYESSDRNRYGERDERGDRLSERDDYYRR